MINFVEMEKRQILNIVEPIMDNCLAESNENNHSKHVRDFTERMKKSRQNITALTLQVELLSHFFLKRYGLETKLSIGHFSSKTCISEARGRYGGPEYVWFY